MFNRLLKKMLSALVCKPLPSLSNSEKKNLSDLQSAFMALPNLETVHALPSEAEWISNMNRLKELVLNQNPREFLQWDVISKTMFIGYAKYIYTELKYLKSLPDWDIRWRNAIKESFVGRPTPYIFYPSSSANLIHHAYHVAKFEEMTECNVQDMDFVFEFGGGYGSMCRLFYNLGFSGRYLIFDLPPFSALQRYFLKTNNLPVKSIGEFVDSKKGIVCVSDNDLLEDIITNIESANKMFVATWSISETPINIRENVLPLVNDYQAFLIAYQDRFGEMDNVDFFTNWKETINGVSFRVASISHLKGNNYLFGGARIDK